MKTLTKTAAKSNLYKTFSTELLVAAQAAAEELLAFDKALWVKMGRKLDTDDIEYAASVGCKVATRLLATSKNLGKINAELFLRD